MTFAPPPVHRRQLLAAAALLPLASARAAAELLPISTRAADAFPRGTPIRLVVPYPPGGTTDIQARTIAQKVQEQTGANVIVENRAGAGGNIGVDVVLKAPRDGCTIGITAMNSFAINPLLTKKLPYDVSRDVQPLTLVGSVANVIAVHPDVPVQDLKQLAALARAQDVTFASPGAGTSVHLSAEMLAESLGVKLRHVAYRGDAPALVDVLGGRVPVLAANLPGVIEHLRSGKLRPIVVTSARRSSLLPGVPTAAESGVPGFDVKAFFALFTARGVPPEVVGALNREFGAAISRADVRKQFAQLGIDAAPSSVEALTALIYLESRKWAPIVAKTGVTWD